MNIQHVILNPPSVPEEKAASALKDLEQLIDELNQKDLPEAVIVQINAEMEELNALLESKSISANKIRASLNRIVTLVEKETKLVPKNYYQKQWLAIGMAAFGIPFGVAFGLALDNMGFIGIGLPFGIAIGVAVGNAMDKKALEAGKQLNFEF